MVVPPLEMQMDPQEEPRRLVQRLRLAVHLSPCTQRAIETRAGLSRGYLSQILNGHVEIKIWHLLVILDAIGTRPADFFFQLFPRRRHRTRKILKGLALAGRGLERPLVLELARLYGYGLESLEELELRLERCEDALAELDNAASSNRLEKDL